VFSKQGQRNEERQNGGALHVGEHLAAGAPGVADVFPRYVGLLDLHGHHLHGRQVALLGPLMV
jgi:hypothetical protein